MDPYYFLLIAGIVFIIGACLCLCLYPNTDPTPNRNQ